MKASLTNLIRRKLGLIFLTLMTVAASKAADLNVLIIGSTSDSNISGKKSTPFSPTEIRNQLASILTGAGRNANVSVINRYGDGGYATYSFAQWFHYPYPAGFETTTRWPNLRGELSNRWDYVILIGDPYTMEYMPGVYAHGVGLVAEEVAKGTKTSGIGQTETVLLMPWPGSTSVSSVAHYKEVVYRAGRTGGHKVAPAALAWEADGANNTVTPTSTRGAYICAASIYSTIWGQSADSGDPLADAVHSTVTTQNAAQQFTGSKMNFQNPYLMLGDKRRDVHFSERGTSTESYTANSCRSRLNSLRVTYDDSYRDKYSSSTPLDDNKGWPSGSLPIAWNGGRTGAYNDWNPSVWQIAYEWPHPTNTHNGVLTTDPNYDVAAENRIHLAEIYSKDLATAASLVGSDATRRNVPFRLIWGSFHKQLPNERPITDNAWHQNGHWITADAAFMTTLYSGRCPVATKPANPDAGWYATKVGYETAWRLGTGSSRAPGFKVMPSAATAKTVTPTTTETMSVEFIFPPTQNVTVNISVSNTGAASLSKTTMTFTPANYNVAQTVVVSGLTGALATEDFNVVYSTVSTDAAYNELSDSWAYTINRPITSTVTFDANGGTTPNPTTKSVTYGSTYGTLATTTRTGYTFNGWFTANSGGSMVTSSTSVTALADHTLYAQWTPTYTVTFDAAAGTTPSPTTKTVTSGATYGTLATTTRSGFIFNGWFTANSGGSLVTSSTSVTALADHTLYAQWTPTYTVTFDATGGTTPSPTTKTVTSGATYGTLATTTRSGFTFNGWFTAASGGTLVTSATTVTATADHTLYAQWTSAATYTVSYNGNGNTGGTAPSNQTKTQGVALTLASNSGNLSKTGYSFAGWNTASGGGGTNYAEGASYTADAAVTLYARWNTPPTANAGLDQTVALGDSSGAPAVITAPSDTIQGFQGASVGGNSTDGSNWPTNESPSKAIDGSTSTKYLNFGKVGSGFYITPSAGLKTLTGVKVSTANDAAGRDPLTVSIEGANGGDLSQGSSWTLIASNVNLGINTDPGRLKAGPLVAITASGAYTSYRVIVQSIRNAAEGSVQYSEFELHGYGTLATATATLDGTATDSDGDTLTTTWSKVSGPGTVSFANPSAVDTTATFTEVGTYVLRLTANDGSGPVYDEMTITVSAIPAKYASWTSGGGFANGFTSTGLTDNPDGDSSNNLMEFAFGTDPTLQDAGSLAINGSVNGSPVPVNAGGEVFEYYFVRRKDHGTSGSVSYTVQFSNDLTGFTNSVATPTFVANSSADTDYEVVKVPFPSGFRFGRLQIETAP